MKNFNNLTVVIVTYKTNKKILINCLKSIDERISVKIVENSKKFKDKKLISKKFRNTQIVCTGKNLGYGSGNNFGLRLVTTDYALILNPDIECDKDFFINVRKIIKMKKNFTIIGTHSINDNIFMPAGFFNTNKNNLYRKNFFIKKQKPLTPVDWVVGCSMMVNLKKFKSKNIFDKNFFLYFEEIDLCKYVLQNKGKIFSSSMLKVHHLGFQSSLASNKKFVSEANNLRDWHWMWSSFYYYKKNYNYFYAVFKTFSKFIKSFFKILFYTICFDNKNRNKYLYRFLGLLNSMIGKKSYFRGKSFN